jgi:hypothetical protein
MQRERGSGNNGRSRVARRGRYWVCGTAVVIAAAGCVVGCSPTQSEPHVDASPIQIDAPAADAAPSTSDAIDAVGDMADASDAVGMPVDCPGPSDPLLPPPTAHIGSSYPVAATPRGSNSLPVFDATEVWTVTEGPGQTGAGMVSVTTGRFSCTQVGDVQLTVHVLLPGTSCDRSLSWTINCQP